jgi:tetratricopeptide (TPR) repeat protein
LNRWRAVLNQLPSLSILRQSLSIGRTGRRGLFLAWYRTLDSRDNNSNGPSEPDRVLNGWREIAAYFGRTQSTVKRWAAERNLPVHRVAGEAARRGLPVYAHVRELSAWRKSGDSQILGADVPGAAVADEAAVPNDESPAPATQPAAAHPDRRRRMLAIGVGIALFVAAAIAAAAWLLPAASPGTDVRAAIPEEARELYLQGTYLWNRRTPEGINGAIEVLTQAIEIHPDYAEAHAGLAMTYNLARQYSGMSGFDAYPLAEKHARRAVELDPTLGFAQSVLAFVEFHGLWQVEAGLARFEEALRLDPESSDTLQWYASSLNLAGRSADALPIVTRAQQLDPDSTSVLNMKAAILFHNGQEDEAIEVLDVIRQRDPGFAWAYYMLYSIDAARGDHASYLENYATLGDMTGLPRYRVVAEAGAAALAEGGVEAMGRAMIAAEMAFFERGEATAWDLARHHALIGDREGALHWLGISLERREERLIGILVDTAFNPIRDAEAFQRLVADIGLPAAT